MCQVSIGKLPAIDSAVDYVAVPDNGLCSDIPGIILSKHFDHKNNNLIIISGVETQRISSYIELVHMRCDELERRVEEEAEAYGIDYLLFHPKSIFYVQQTESLDALAVWLSTLDLHDPYALSLCCRKDPRMDRVIIPVIGPVLEWR